MIYCGQPGCPCTATYRRARSTDPDQRGKAVTIARVQRYLEREARIMVENATVCFASSPLGPECQLLIIGARQVHVKIYDGSVFLYCDGNRWEHFPFPKRMRGKWAAKRLFVAIVHIAEQTRQRTAAEMRAAEENARLREEALATETQRLAKIRKHQQAYDAITQRLGVLDTTAQFIADEYGARLQLHVRLTPVQAEKVLAALMEAKVIVACTALPVDTGG